ncbi:fibronectin type III domain-containing protein [Kocuria sp. M1R5S2]|uniref:fibronectin type III domain-containing protein n=1 Tax=Kocuria rhizosphaerae TaxID=3376285 RepID=UPI0037AD1F80
MDIQKITGTAAGVTALLLASGATAAHAVEEDTTPPELVSFEVTLSLVDARVGGTVTAEMHITDETCLDAYDPNILLSDAMGHVYAGPEWAARTSGDCQDGVYEVSFDIPATEMGHQPFGGWDATIYPLSDTLGNSADLYHPSFFGKRYFTYAASPDAVSDVQVTSTDSGGLTASWSVPEANGAPISRYVVEIEDVSGDVVYTTAVQDPLLDNAAVPLVDGHRYRLEVTAHNVVGGTETTGVSFWTDVAKYTPPVESPFVDITPETTFYPEMAWMAENSISGGWDTGEGRKEYRPHTAVDRDVMAAFLYRLAGSPEYTPPVESPFVDITPETTFYPEMAWMAENSISGGWDTGEGRKEYRPHTAVDRDVMAAFLYRLAGSPEYTPPVESPFVDITATTTFYREMAWMAENNISGGWDIGEGRKEYRPHTAVDRDVMAAFLYRLAGVL